VGIAAKEPAKRSDEEKDTLARFYRRVAPELEPLRQALRARTCARPSFSAGFPSP
jgi:hypothetical protein